MEQLSVLRDKHVVLVSTEPWGDAYVSKHYYAEELSKHNDVWFLNPVAIPWRPEFFFRIPVRAGNTGVARLTQVTYGNPLPRLTLWPYAVQKRVFKRVISQVSRALGLDRTRLVVWNFDLGRFVDLGDWQAVASIAHVVENLDHYYFAKEYRYRTHMVRSADLVLAVADLIKAQVESAVPGVPVTFVNHGAAIEAFERSLGEGNVSLPGGNQIKAGFVGNFQQSFDFDLLLRLASASPEVDFILIGPRRTSNLGDLRLDVAERVAEAESRENIYFVGLVPSRDIMRYLMALDINLVLIQSKHVAEHCNPHKLMAYFFAGKPIVSTYIDQYKDRPDLIFMAKDQEEILARFSSVLSHLRDEGMLKAAEQRRKMARDNSYAKQVARIDRLLLGSEQI